MIENSNNVSKAMQDLDVVYCSVDLILGNKVLFDRLKLYKKFSKKASGYLKENGVKYRIEEPASLGGGAGFLWDTIKYLWDNRAIITILFTLFRYAFSYGRRFFSGSAIADKPRVYVSMRIKTNVPMVDDKYFKSEELLIDRLINLKNLSDGLCELLEKQYPIFLFDQSINARLLAKSYRVTYFIPHERRNLFNRTRLMYLFKGLKVRNNFDSRYSFDKRYLITRVDGKTEYENGFWKGEKDRKKYYLFKSNRIIKDYFGCLFFVFSFTQSFK